MDDHFVLEDTRSGRRSGMYTEANAALAAQRLNAYIASAGCAPAFVAAKATDDEVRSWYGGGDGSVLAINGATYRG